MNRVFSFFVYIAFTAFCVGLITFATMGSHSGMNFMPHVMYDNIPQTDACLNLHIAFMQECRTVVGSIIFASSYVLLAVIYVSVVFIFLLASQVRYRTAREYIPITLVEYRHWLALFEKRAD